LQLKKLASKFDTHELNKKTGNFPSPFPSFHFWL